MANKYGPEAIKKGAFPRKRREELLHLGGGMFQTFKHKATPGGYTLSRKEIEERRNKRFDRSTKHRANPDRSVPSTSRDVARIRAVAGLFERRRYR